jgi:hypothetical protein
MMELIIFGATVVSAAAGVVRTAVAVMQYRRRLREAPEK